MKTSKDAMNEAKSALGYSFTVPADLSPDKREHLYDMQADIILGSPADYPENVVAWAEKRRNGAWYGVPYEDYSVADAAGDFAGEVGNQIVSLNDAVNPFSEANRKKLIYIAAAGLVIYLAAPYIVKAFAEGRVK